MQTQLKVQSILALSNAFPEKELPPRQIKKPTDTKIKSLILQQIVQALEGKSGALFPSASAPKVVIGLLSSLCAPKKQDKAKTRSSRPPTHPTFLKGIPVGLRRCEPHHWINSLLQFFLFLPGSWELCSLIPRSYQPLREFSDQYFSDQEANLPLSSADSAEVVRCLIRKLPAQYPHKKSTLFEILISFLTALFPRCPFDKPGEIHPVALHPEWHISDAPDLENKFQEIVQTSPPEILVGAKKHPHKSHYFSLSNGAFYDLDAFIELRPDGDHQEHYVAYLKCGGIWYQCDDDRIAPFRTNCLNAPLRRAVLLHYKRIDLLRMK